MAGDTFFGSNLKPGKHHVGRGWSGPDDLYQEECCQCPKTPCGLTVWGEWDKDCDFHGPLNAIRQSHPEDKCPNAS
jgi:hypothetical protein